MTNANIKTFFVALLCFATALQSAEKRKPDNLDYNIIPDEELITDKHNVTLKLHCKNTKELVKTVNSQFFLGNNTQHNLLEALDAISTCKEVKNETNKKLMSLHVGYTYTTYVNYQWTYGNDKAKSDLLDLVKDIHLSALKILEHDIHKSKSDLALYSNTLRHYLILSTGKMIKDGQLIDGHNFHSLVAMN